MADNKESRIRTEWPRIFEALGKLVIMGGPNVHVGGVGGLDLALNPRLQRSVAISARGQAE